MDDPDGNVEHIAKHGLDIEDVEHILSAPLSERHSHSSGLPVVWGYTPDGRYTIVVYEQIDAHMIRVVTAYEVSEPRDQYSVKSEMTGAARTPHSRAVGNTACVPVNGDLTEY